jgi:hypothetical protein
MAHVQEAGKAGSPHSHGSSWAIYGNVLGATDMTEWRRVNPESEDHAVLEVSDKYAIGPAKPCLRPECHPFHRTSGKCWVIRITGGDLTKFRSTSGPRRTRSSRKLNGITPRSRPVAGIIP